MSTCLVEAVTCSVEDALTAQECGVDRIEVCSAIESGGITPSIGLVKEILAHCSIPVVVMLRPRAGHFEYSEFEVQTMLRDVEAFARTGIQGIVFGALLKDGRINEQVCSRLVKACQGIDTVCHRAFDQTPSVEESFDTVKRLGFNRLLTSGHSPRAIDGADTLRWMVEKGGIDILGAGSIRPDNIPSLIASSGVTQIHLGPFKQIDAREGIYGVPLSVLDGDVMSKAVGAARASGK